ncbi:hypothetical protein BDV59DRAFT_203695 [Aspergillus ambiguus]|uniref:uncharacterized protein n=1 Tax=Aspergillus ambiguus TaxID=176160 RepID=UPI003CCE1781
MSIDTGRRWFDELHYIGATIEFPEGSKWKLDKVVKLTELCWDRFSWENYELYPEVRALYYCEKVSGPGPSDAVIKIHMQVPRKGTATEDASVRAQQACPSGFASDGRNEARALEILQTNNCSSAPKLLDCKFTTQSDDEGVPGGYKDYILMECLPGISPESTFENNMDGAERRALRAAFKAAWLDCIACGVCHEDPGQRNLLWDKQNNKCYLVDWELYHPAGEEDVWKDSEYQDWDMESLSGSLPESG